MKHWRELEVAALLGSQKAQALKHWPNDEAGILAQQLADSPQALLHQLALFSVYQRAGQQAQTLSPQPAAASESLPYANAAMSQHLPYVLSHDGQAFLPHWLDYARQRGVLVPRRYLPTLLKLGENHKAWRLMMAAVAGERGGWLAQQNPDWVWLQAAQFDLTSPEIDTFWQNAPLAGRELLFERLRLHDASRARDFLQKIWPEENANTRKLLLEKLLTGLSMADHDFLASCLDDRSKAVKEVAIDLLARLPASALVQRMQAVVTHILHIKHGMMLKNIEVTPLEQLTPALERDGLDAKAKQVEHLGAKAQWLRDVFACVSLDWLLSYTSMDAATLLEKLLKSEWAMALYSGLLTAAKRQQHQDCLRAFLYADNVAILVNHDELLALLPAAQREQYLLEILVPGKTLAAKLKAVTDLLGSMPVWSWSTDFTLKLLESYQALTQAKAQLSYEFERQVFPQLLTLIGRCGEPTLGLQPNAYPSQVLTNWQFRRELQQAFAAENNRT